VLLSRLLPFVLFIAPLGAVAVPVNLAGAATRRITRDQVAVAEFTHVVNKYVDLHRMLAAPRGPEEMCSNWEELQRRTQRLAGAIRAERPTARAGHIFTPTVASFVRRHIAAALRDTAYDVGTFLNEMEEDSLPEVPPLEVNGAFPWAAGNLMWPSMLQRLPPLPEEIQYRFVGRNLVLLDIRANLVVDVLKNALPAVSIDTESTGDSQSRHAPPGPCDVHPELGACWT
jgi:hypothetical protein